MFNFRRRSLSKLTKGLERLEVLPQHEVEDRSCDAAEERALPSKEAVELRIKLLETAMSEMKNSLKSSELSYNAESDAASSLTDNEDSVPMETGDGTGLVNKRLQRVERTMRSQATATLRELHVLEGAQRALADQVASLASSQGISFGIEGDSSSLQARIAEAETRIETLAQSAASTSTAMLQLQENETKLKQTCQELASVIEKIRHEQSGSLDFLLDELDGASDDGRKLLRSTAARNVQLQERLHRLEICAEANGWRLAVADPAPGMISKHPTQDKVAPGKTVGVHKSEQSIHSHYRQYAEEFQPEVRDGFGAQPTGEHLLQLFRDQAGSRAKSR